MKRSHQAVWTHDDGPFRQLVIVLLDSFEIVSGRVGLSDGPGREVHDLVPIPRDVSVKFSDAYVRPVAPYHGENMPQSIRPTTSEI